MTLWLILALMTAAAVFAVLWPLSRVAPVTGGSDIAVYRDQLDEIARDRAAGLLGEAEAEAARIEVSRRLIAASDAEARLAAARASPLWHRRAAAVVALVVLPVGAALFYLASGSPDLPGAPLQSRMQAAAEARNGANGRSIENMVSQVEAHLERNPGDARGYAVLAPVYMRLGRFNEAVAARQKILALSGESAERLSDLGEALTAAANGIVTSEAKSTFERAVALDGTEFKSRYFIGLAAEQDGQRDKAAALWNALLEQAPPGAPWLALVRESIERVGGTPATTAQPRGPTQQDVAAANDMTAEERGAMIRGMVAQLADRLKQNGDDVEGWQRLLRAYMVLGDRDKAQEAAGDARRALASDAEKVRRIDDLIKSLGLQG